MMNDKIYSVISFKLQRFCTLRCLSQGYCFSKHSGRFQQWEKLERIEQQQKTHQVYRKRHNAFGKEKNTSSRISLFNWWVWSLENLIEIRASQGLYTLFVIRVSMNAVTKKKLALFKDLASKTSLLRCRKYSCEWLFCHTFWLRLKVSNCFFWGEKTIDKT